jgi:hypothetical protein
VTSMTPLLSYLAKDIARSQRYLPPVLAYLLVAAVVFGGDPGPALPAYSIVAVMIYPVGAWLAVTCANAEDPVLRTVTVVTAGSWLRVGAAVTALACSIVVVLTVLGSVIPAAVHGYSISEIATGATAQLITGLAGVVLGVLCGRPVVRQVGVSAIVVIVVVLVTFALGKIPPVGAVIGLLSQSDHGIAASQHPGWVLGGDLAIVLALLVAATWLAAEVGRRRD